MQHNLVETGVEPDTTAASGNKPERLALSVVSPCCNEATGIVEFCRRVAAAISAAAVHSYEIILIDDGSTDSTWHLIAELAAADPHVVGVRLSRNFGHQAALTAGLAHAEGKLVFVLDADLQDPPELLAAMLDRVTTERAEIVYGRRRSRQGETAFKRFTAAGFYRLLDAMTDIRIPLDTGDFRLMTRRMAQLLASMPERDRFMRGMASWSGFKQVPFDYDRDARHAGTTKYPLRRMLRFASDAMISFSLLPVRVAGLLSGLFFIALLGLLAYVAISYMFFDPAPGWTSTALLILGTSSVQMFTLAVISEYVGRLYMDSKRRPLFIVDEVTGTPAEDKSGADR